MINDFLLYTLDEFQEYKQKIVKAYKNFFPLKFKMFEIRGFDSTVTTYIDNILSKIYHL